jgi:Mn-dependent DtxR family transcriptional regulator
VKTGTWNIILSAVVGEATVKDIATATDLSEGTVRCYLKEMARRGVVSAEQRQSCTVYSLVA